MENCRFQHEWILFLDADEQLTAQVMEEIDQRLADVPPDVHGFYIPFLYYFIGKPLKKAMRPHLRLMRNTVRWSRRGPIREFPDMSGHCPLLQNRIIHRCRRGLSFLIGKYNQHSSTEALSLFHRLRQDALPSPDETRSFPRRVWSVIERRFPPLPKALALLAYNFFARFEPSGGTAWLMFLMIYGFWFPLLIDAKVIELRNNQQDADDPLPRAPRNPSRNCENADPSSLQTQTP
jgi:hypothetical protein